MKEHGRIQRMNSIKEEKEEEEKKNQNKKTELKPLPHGLKCVYLDENESNPIVILSLWTKDQEHKLLLKGA